MTDFVKRIDEKLIERNLKRAALCTDLELSPTSITDWARRGTVPAGDICIKIAHYLNVSVEWLITGIEEKLSHEEQKLLAQFKALTPEQADTVRTLLNKWEADRIAKEKKELNA
ncbi:MAG: helix-turn-helix transcriptional regulator [Treponema sp.]|nr:helix-turn-helix transcriptional regulator [Treponema sp.]